MKKCVRLKNGRGSYEGTNKMRKKKKLKRDISSMRGKLIEIYSYTNDKNRIKWILNVYENRIRWILNMSMEIESDGY